MTAVESLPRYAEAEALARSRGVDLISLLGAYVSGYADSGTPAYALDNAPGEVVCKSPSEARSYMDTIISGAERG
ncbi:hypothetical protein [Bifidobacterium eulemuris]|uniref:Uncharacterized protein n=1 Tax=Bifidobacterium eulemuris TaxID=1765219 RepID=A0A7L9SRX3_9BIFI|nr:hypothetical protein [Bifidobacterium eulemuris]QOL32872.1 hypothetical protein BE0216_10810 [Bifidobacterium eulemuris]